MEGVQSEIDGEAANCSVVVQASKLGVGILLYKELKEDLFSVSSDDYRARIRRDCD